LTRSFFGFLDVFGLLVDGGANFGCGLRLRFFIGLSCNNRGGNLLLNLWLLSRFLHQHFFSNFFNNFDWLYYLDNCSFWFFLLLFGDCSRWLFGIDERLKSGEVIINRQLLQAIPSFLLFLEEALHSRLTLLCGFLSCVDFVPKHFLSRCELPVSVTVLEHLVVSVGHYVDVQLSAKHHVLIHSLASNFCNFLLSKFEERVAFGSRCLFAARDAQFCDSAKLLEKLAELFFVEALRQVTNVNNPPCVWLHS